MKVPAVQEFSKSVQDVLRKPETLTPALAYLMAPFALAGYTLAFWRLGADLNWAREFFITKGLLSRWQVWLAIGAATHIAANQINRLGRSDKTAAS